MKRFLCALFLVSMPLAGVAADGTRTANANASKTKAAKLLAVFVVDTKDEVLAMPLPH